MTLATFKAYRTPKSEYKGRPTISTHVVVELRFRFAAEFRIRIIAVDYVFYKIVNSEDAEDARGVLGFIRLSYQANTLCEHLGRHTVQ